VDVRIGALDQPQERPNQPRLGGGFGRPGRFGQDRAQQVEGLALQLRVLRGERLAQRGVAVAELEGCQARPVVANKGCIAESQLSAKSAHWGPVVANEGCIAEGQFSMESARLGPRESCGIEREGRVARVSYLGRSHGAASQGLRQRSMTVDELERIPA
jgi:hypothetical protein